MNEVVKRSRGRPRKPKLSIEEQEDAVILKYITGQPLTLDETALAIWMAEGRKTAKPLSRVYIAKLEESALKKIKAGLAKYGITSSRDMFLSSMKNYHEHRASKYFNSIDGDE